MEQGMEREFHDLKTKVDDIHRLLLGSDHEEEVGILYRIRQTEKEIKTIWGLINNTKYFLMGMVVPATYGMYDIVKAIINSFAK